MTSIFFSHFKNVSVYNQKQKPSFPPLQTPMWISCLLWHSFWGPQIFH